MIKIQDRKEQKKKFRTSNEHFFRIFQDVVVYVGDEGLSKNLWLRVYFVKKNVENFSMVLAVYGHNEHGKKSILAGQCTVCLKG